MQEKAKVEARVEELIQPLLIARGLELVEVQYSRPRRGRAILRLFLDREGGITLEELTRMSRVVGELLDVHDPIPGSYTLEVSSPGLTRELKKPEDYRRYAGRLARVTTRAPLNGRQVHLGVLRGLEEDRVMLEVEGEAVVIPLDQIARARLEIDLKNLPKEG